MEEDKTKSGLKKIKLFEERGPTSWFIDAEIDGNGILIVSGQDVEDAPRQWFDDDDYEFLSPSAPRIRAVYFLPD
jgi:hypothetical protein